MVQRSNTSECSHEFERDAKTECFRLMLQADADVHIKDSEDFSIFERILRYETSVSSNDYSRAFSVSH